MSLPGHYTPQLVRSLVLPFPGTSSKISWDFLPRLPRCPSVPPPLLPCRAGFGSVQPVTPLINTYRTTDILLVSVASPISSAPLPSLRVCRPRPPGPRPSGMVGRPYPHTTWPLYPSTGQVLGPAFSGNVIQNFLGFSPPPPSLSFCPTTSLAMPCWVWQCAASDPLDKYLPHYRHFTRFRCLSY